MHTITSLSEAFINSRERLSHGSGSLLSKLCKEVGYDRVSTSEYIDSGVSFPKLLSEQEFEYSSEKIGEIYSKLLNNPTIEDIIYEEGKRNGNSKEILYPSIRSIFMSASKSFSGVLDAESSSKYYYRYLCSEYSKSDKIALYLFSILYLNGQRNQGILDKVLESSPLLEIVRGMILEIIKENESKFKYLSEEGILRYINSKLPSLFQINMGVYREFVNQRNLGYSKYPLVLGLYKELSSSLYIYKADELSIMGEELDRLISETKSVSTQHKLYELNRKELLSSEESIGQEKVRVGTSVEDRNSYNNSILEEYHLVSASIDEEASDIVKLVKERDVNKLEELRERVSSVMLLEGLAGEEEESEEDIGKYEEFFSESEESEESEEDIIYISEEGSVTK